MLHVFFFGIPFAIGNGEKICVLKLERKKISECSTNKYVVKNCGKTIKIMRYKVCADWMSNTLFGKLREKFTTI